MLAFVCLSQKEVVMFISYFQFNISAHFHFCSVNLPSSSFRVSSNLQWLPLVVSLLIKISCCSIFSIIAFKTIVKMLTFYFVCSRTFAVDVGLSTFLPNSTLTSIDADCLSTVIESCSFLIECCFRISDCSLMVFDCFLIVFDCSSTIAAC